MKYGIKYENEGYALYKNGNKKRVYHRVAWYADKKYDTMRAAKDSLEIAKEILEEDLFHVNIPNSLTVEGVRVSTVGRPTKHEERITYHIEPRK